MVAMVGEMDIAVDELFRDLARATRRGEVPTVASRGERMAFPNVSGTGSHTGAGLRRTGEQPLHHFGIGAVGWNITCGKDGSERGQPRRRRRPSTGRQPHEQEVGRWVRPHWSTHSRHGVRRRYHFVTVTCLWSLADHHYVNSVTLVLIRDAKPNVGQSDRAL